MAEKGAPDAGASEGPRLLDVVRDAIRRRHYSLRTEESYVHWIRRFIYFSGRRHPRELGAAEVTAFLNHLARERNVAASTQNQALSALLFLYREALGTPLPWLDELERAQRPARLPTVLTPLEARRLLARMSGTRWLMASLLYGAGLRLRECLGLAGVDADRDRERNGDEREAERVLDAARGGARRAVGDRRAAELESDAFYWTISE
jgi:site-specific recombinase XerD